MLSHAGAVCEEEGRLLVTTFPVSSDSNPAGPISYKDAVAPIPQDIQFSVHMFSSLPGLENMVGVKGF